MQSLLYHTHRNEYGNTGLLTFSVNVKEELPNSTETEINPHRPTETKLPSQNISFALSFTIPCILNLDCHLSRDWQARFWLGKQRRRQSVPGQYQMLGVLVEGSHWELAKGDLKSRWWQRLMADVKNSQKGSKQLIHLDMAKGGGKQRVARRFGGSLLVCFSKRNLSF